MNHYRLGPETPMLLERMQVLTRQLILLRMDRRMERHRKVHRIPAGKIQGSHLCRIPTGKIQGRRLSRIPAGKIQIRQNVSGRCLMMDTRWSRW